MDHEGQLIRDCQSGKLDQFAGLYELYFDKIYRFVYYRTHHQQTAEDLTSATFLKAIKNIGTLKANGSSFSAWLYRIARNCIIDHYRSARPTEDIENAWDLADETDVHRDAEVREKVRKVRELLRKFPPDQRDVVLMRAWDDMTYRDIAEALGKTEEACRVSFSRAVKKLSGLIAMVVVFLIHASKL